MLFEDLSAGVLAHLMSGAQSWIFIVLWQIGNRHLHSKLVNGGVLDVHLRNSYDMIGGKWPGCLGAVHLRSLHISHATGLVEHQKGVQPIHACVASLYNGLTRLELLFPGAFGAILLSAEVDPLWDMGSAFPSLTHLALLVSDPRHDTPRIPIRKLDLLPRTLTSLHLVDGFLAELSTSSRGPEAEFSTSVASHVLVSESYGSSALTMDKVRPISFEKLLILQLGSKSIDSADLWLLPPSLTAVHGLSHRALEAIAHDPSLIPNLALFPIYQHGHNPFNFIVPLHRASNISEFDFIRGKDGAWPNGIFSLQLCTSSNGTDEQEERGKMERLPPSLTSLQFDHCNYSPIFAPQWIEHSLPTTLTSLKVAEFVWSGIEPEIWPPHLTHLELSNTSSFGPLHFHRLPRGLKIFVAARTADHRYDYGVSPSWEDDLDPGTPSPVVLEKTSLRTTNGALVGEKADYASTEGERRRNEKNRFAVAAEALGRRMLTHQDEEKWSTLSFKILMEAEKKSEQDLEAARRYISRVEKGQLYGLPLDIVDLKLGYLHSGEYSSFILPPFVRRTQLEPGMAITNGKVFWELLPPTLEHLDVAASNNIDQQCWTVFRSSQPSASPLYRSKLAYLRLTISEEQMSSIKHSFALYLPFKLRILDINLPGAPASSDVLNLPTSLERLTLSTMNPCKSETPWVGYLPRSLKHLKLNSLLLSSDNIEDLPPKLEILEAQFDSNTTFRHLYTYLPKTLRVLTLPKDSAIHDHPLQNFCSKIRPFWRIWTMFSDETSSSFYGFPTD